MKGALSDAGFADLMDRFGPFEATPVVAIGVSGGPDSMALALLLHAWCKARGGRVVALTVEHGLRPESAAEAAAVGRRLRALGIRHRVLPWLGPKPLTGTAAAARGARYALLGAWCRDHAILHLAVAHHRDDQAETVLLRQVRGSGPAGLAGMAPMLDGWPRLLRPLLPVPRDRLQATVTVRGIAVVDDPSNRDPRFARGRLRAELAGAGGERRRNLAAAQADRAKGTRMRAEKTLLNLAGACLEPQPGGYCWLALPALAAAPAPGRRALLARVLQAVGGEAYAPRGERLGRLADLIGTGALRKGRTLGGCRVIPVGARLLICREWQHAAPPLALAPGKAGVWDRRFRVAGEGTLPSGLTVGALGAEGWARLGARRPPCAAAIPHPARLSLPAFRVGDEITAVPHLGVQPLPVAGRQDWRARAEFRPAQPVTGAWAALVSTSTAPIYGV